MLPILRPSYWFTLYPAPLAPVIENIIFVVMAFLFCIGLALTIYARRASFSNKSERVGWRRLGTRVIWAGIVGLYLYAVTALQVPVLNMHAWFILWAILFTWLISTALRELMYDIPALKKEDMLRRSYEKWLPKPKK